MITFLGEDKLKSIDIKKTAKILYIFLLFFVLVIPISKIDESDRSIIENRMLAKFPQNIDKNFGQGFERWIADRYRFRNIISSTYLKCDRIVSGRISNSSAFEGKNKWLFYKDENSVQNFLDNNLFSIEELEVIKDNLENRQIFLNKLGIKYYLLICPDKNRAYGDFYPNYIQKIGTGGGRGEQVFNYLKDHSQVNVVYPLQQILTERKHNILYFKNDTHWNTLGAFLGYEQLISLCSKDFKLTNKLNVSDMELSYKDITDGDLQSMLQLTYEYYTGEKNPVFNKRLGYKFIYKENKGRAGVYTINKDNAINVFMFRDSYATSMIPYLSETFGNVRYIWTQNFVGNIESIRAEKPQIVISELVERSLHVLACPDPIIKEDI